MEQTRRRRIVLALAAMALLPVASVPLFVVGCANQAQLAQGDSRSWPERLTDDERARMEQVAWDAAHSPETVESFKIKRSTDAPMQLRRQGIHVYLDKETRDKADVAIPDHSVKDVYHAYYVGVTVDRETYEVLGMHESFWP